MTETVAISNVGGATLVISNVVLSGPNAADFAESETCTGTPIRTAGACAIDVSFAPLGEGERDAIVNITDNDSTSPQSIPISGTGVLTDSATLTPVPTNTPIATATAGMTTTVTATAGMTTTVTATAGMTTTVTASATVTPTDTLTSTAESSATISPTSTVAATPTVALSASSTATMPTPTTISLSTPTAIARTSAGASATALALLRRRHAIATAIALGKVIVPVGPTATPAAPGLPGPTVTGAPLPQTQSTALATSTPALPAPTFPVVLYAPTPSHGRRVAPALVVDWPTQRSSRVGRWPIHLATIPYVRVAIVLEVVGSNNTVIYRSALRGDADLLGQFSELLHSAYIPAHPVLAHLTVTVHLPRRTITRTVTMTLSH